MVNKRSSDLAAYANRRRACGSRFSAILTGKKSWIQPDNSMTIFIRLLESLNGGRKIDRWGLADEAVREMNRICRGFGAERLNLAARIVSAVHINSVELIVSVAATRNPAP